MSKNKKESLIETTGYVVEVLPNANFIVKLENEHVVLAHTAGKIRKKRIRIITGDKVLIEMSIYDKNRGRIVYREKNDGSLI